jgi:hypothetical protein
VGFSPNVRFRKQFAFHNNSRLSTVRCNEAGVGGGVLSGVNLGFCRPFLATHSTTVRVNKSFVDYDFATHMYMNCAGPDGPWNTIGQVIFLGNMLSAKVPEGGKFDEKSCFKLPGIFGSIADLAGQAKSIYNVGKKLYELADTDWSDPSSVLGAIGGLAGIANLQKTAEALETARGFYDLGEKVLDTEWSDPQQALSTIAGLASVANMDDFAATAQIAGSIQQAIETDWKDPRAAIAAATGVIKNSGLDAMAVEMANKSGIDLGFIPPLMNNLPAMFPLPGSAGAQATSQPLSPLSNAAKPGGPLTKAAVNELAQSSPIAWQRYQALPNTDHGNAAGALVEFNDNSFNLQSKGSSSNDSASSTAGKAAALYIPEANPSKLQQSSGAGWGEESGASPGKLKEVFVASQDSASKGEMFGVREKGGEVYLFGGSVNQDPKSATGKPKRGQGALESWWIAESALDNHLPEPTNQNSEGNSDFEEVVSALKGIASAFEKGEPKSPLRLPLDSINGGGSSLAGTMSAIEDSLTGVKDELTNFGTGVFDSVSDFYNDLFGDDASAAANTGNSQAAQSGGAGGGAGGAAGAAGSLSLPVAKPKSFAAPPSVGVDGILITITQGTLGAAGAAIEASFRALNASALDSVIKTKEVESGEDEHSHHICAEGGLEGSADFTTTPIKEGTRTHDRIRSEIEKIKASEFGTQTSDGPKVVSVLEQKLANGQIVLASKNAPGSAHFNRSTGLIYLEDSNFHGSARLGSVLVHEGTHVLDNNEFPNAKHHIETEQRAYENQVRYLLQFEPRNPIIDQFYSFESRADFGDYLRSREGGYQDVLRGRYRSNIFPVLNRPIRKDYETDESFRRDVLRYENGRLYDQSIQFEIDRQKLFEIDRAAYETK